MKKKDLIKCVVAAFLSLAATSCSKNTVSSAEQEFVDNFNALVMGGKTIDTNQDWNTIGEVPVTISVDLGNTDSYNVYILQTPPIFKKDGFHLGMVTLQSGESKTINIPKPANAGLLYAACFDTDGHAMCKPFPILASGTEVAFNSKSPEGAEAYQATTGNNWSTSMPEMPDLSAYTTGTLVDISNQDIKMSDDTDTHFIISSNYSGYILALETYKRTSVYVTGTWTLNNNQRLAEGNVIVVGAGGKININKGYALTTNMGENEGSGMIFVQPGGEITGDGTVTFCTATGIYYYNAGTINVAKIQLEGCNLYNSGVIGQNLSTSIICASDASGNNCKLTNTGNINLTSFTGDIIAFDNGGYMNVINDLQIDRSSKMDDGSYLECKNLTLNGNSDGSATLYMGNAAFLNCQGNISINNYGVWGPSGSNHKANAILKFNNCIACATTDGAKGTYLLDNVELILPENFPTVFDNGALNVWDASIKSTGIGTLQPSFSGYTNLYMLYHWFNGYEGKTLNASNYQWVQTDNKINLCWNTAITTCATSVDASNQTCTYSTSPSYNYTGTPGFGKASTGSEPVYNCIYYAFETMESNTKDYDFNDVVLRVNVPTDNGDGTFNTAVQVMCVGTALKTTVYYNGEILGEEVHAAIGASTTTKINTSSVTRSFRKLADITFSNNDFKISKLNFSLKVADDSGNEVEMKQPTTYGEAPLYIVVNSNTEKEWYWPSEGINIGVAYPYFSAWASNVKTYTDWYDSSNAFSSKVVTY